MEECQHLLELLRRYEEASGQVINRLKTAIFQLEHKTGG